MRLLCISPWGSSLRRFNACPPPPITPFSPFPHWSHQVDPVQDIVVHSVSSEASEIGDGDIVLSRRPSDRPRVRAAAADALSCGLLWSCCVVFVGVVETTTPSHAETPRMPTDDLPSCLFLQSSRVESLCAPCRRCAPDGLTCQSTRTTSPAWNAGLLPPTSTPTSPTWSAS